MRPTRHPIIALTALLAIAGGALALAPDGNPLRGPSVEDNTAPGGETTFGGMDAGKMVVNQRVPHRTFMAALRALAEQDNAKLTPTPEQIEAVRAIEQAYLKDVRDFQRANAEEFRALRETLGMNDRGRRPGADRPEADRPRGERLGTDAKPTPEQEAARARLAELRKATPSPESAHTEIWAVLTEPQRDWIDAHLAAQREADEQRRMAELAAPGGEPMDDAMAPGTRSNLEGFNLPEDLASDPRLIAFLEQLAKMPPQQRDRLLTGLERLMDRASRDQPRRERPAPPSMDDVEVPRPEGDRPRGPRPNGDRPGGDRPAN